MLARQMVLEQLELVLAAWEHAPVEIQRRRASGRLDHDWEANRALLLRDTCISSPFTGLSRATSAKVGAQGAGELAGVLPAAHCVAFLAVGFAIPADVLLSEQ